MSKLLFMLFLCLVPISFQTYARPKCFLPEIAHGSVRRRSGARLARFSCNPHYELVGNKYATCRLGQWDVPLPVCIRSGCDDLEVENGVSLPSHRGAWMVFYCFPGYRLAGSPTLYCDGHRWNATTPKCVPDKGSEPQLSCDFESEDLCGWRQDELHDFDWSRLNTKTPSAFLFTGPSYDHTFGKGFSGYYMFIESTSKLTNDSARLISPIYDGSLSKNGCFSFFYHMYGKSIGGLRVYQIPEGLHQVHANMTWSDKQDYLLFEKWGDHGDFWFRNVSKLRDTAGNFQIVIEGIRGTSFTSDIAIDDVAILQGADCDAAIATAVTPSAEISETCAGRCDIFGKAPAGRSCGCSATCVTDDNCCPDFFELCVYNNGPGQPDDDDSTSDQPLTEKLIRTPSTPPTTTSSSTSTTTTTPFTTSTTVTLPRIFTIPPTRVTVKTTTSTTIPSTSTSTTTSPTTTTTSKPTFRPTTKTSPTTRPTTPPSTSITTTRPTTTRPTSTRASFTTASTRRSTSRVTGGPTRLAQKTTSAVQSDAAKAKMEQGMQARKVVAEKHASSSGATAAVITTLFLSVCIVFVALSLRTARGRAALARMRGRASDDPEVRYLTRDDD